MKRIAALRDLSDDHHTALLLARRCQQTPAGAADAMALSWRRVRDAFVLHLDPHFGIEDAHLLPALVAIGEPALAARIRSDHTELRALAEQADPVPEALVRFGALLEAHVRFEEREVFATTQHRLPASALDAIAAACLVIRRDRSASQGS